MSLQLESHAQSIHTFRFNFGENIASLLQLCLVSNRHLICETNET